MNKQAIIEFFNQRSLAWDEHLRTDDEKIGQILDAAGVGEGSRVLDVGCGTGVLIPYYLERGAAEITAIDIAPEMIAHARAKFDDKRVRLVCADADEFQTEQPADCCMIYNAFPHFIDRPSVIANLRKSLRPGGRLTIAHDRGRRAVDDRHERRGASEISRGMADEKELSEILADAGFTGIDCHVTTEIYIVSAVNTVLYERRAKVPAYAYCQRNDFAQLEFSPQTEEIGERAFFMCAGLQKIRFAEGLKNVGRGAFARCEGLTEVKLPASLKAVGADMFRGCTALRQAKLPADIQVIRRGAFFYCESLEEIEVPDSAEKIESSVFWGCTGLKSVRLPQGLTELSGYQFWDCTALETICLPDSITNIGAHTFHGCRNLKRIHLPKDLREIGDGAFYDCVSLKQIELPQGLLRIGIEAFRKCEALRKLTIPASVTELSLASFTVCPGLRGVDIRAKLPDYNNAFDVRDTGAPFRVHALTPLQITAGQGQYRAALGFLDMLVNGEINKAALQMSGKTEISSDDKTENVDYIEGSAYENPEKSASYIQAYAAYIREHAEDFYPLALQKEAVLEGLIQLEAIPLRDIEGLMERSENSEDPQIRAMLLAYQNQSFDDADFDALFEEQMDEMEHGPSEKELQRIWGSAKTEDGICLTHWRQRETYVIVPDTIAGRPVTELSDYLFQDQRGLEQVFLPESLVKIGQAAFRRCDQLTQIEIPENVCRIGASAFQNCGGLFAVRLPRGLRTLDAYTFSSCTALEHVDLPPDLLRIGVSAFYRCTGLKRIRIPASVSEIAADAFAACPNLILEGDAGSAAQRYAMEHGLMFEESAG